MNCPASGRALMMVVVCRTLLSTGSMPAQEIATTSAAGYEIAYATYFGGSAWDQAREVIPQADGTVLIGGMTASSNVPTTPGVIQPR